MMRTEKKRFQAPAIELILLRCEDLISTSRGGVELPTVPMRLK